METVDLLERCRAGEPEAFRALVAHWGDRALGIARCFTDDERRAQRATGDALVAVWRELPSLHSQRAFRPWLMAHVAEQAGAGEEDARATALRAARVHDRRGMEAMREARAVAAADDTVRRLLDEIAGDEHALPQTFFDEVVAPRLSRAHLAEVRRAVDAAPDTVWRTLTDAESLPRWISASDVRASGILKPGSTVRARGKIAELRASSDRTLVTRTEPGSLLCWTTRSRPRGRLGTIEFRWSISIEPGPELRHRLHAVAFPPGLPGVLLRRLYARVESGMPLSMHRGLERFSALVSSRR